MAGDIKNKVQEFDKLYTELLTAQQNACVVGTPDRCTHHVVVLSCKFFRIFFEKLEESLYTIILTCQ